MMKLRRKSDTILSQQDQVDHAQTFIQTYARLSYHLFKRGAFELFSLNHLPNDLIQINHYIRHISTSTS